MEANAVPDGNAETVQGRQIAETPPQGAGARQQPGQGTDLGRESCRVEDGGDLRSHPAILQGGQIKKGRSTAKDDTAPCQAALLLEQDLGGAQGDDAGQRPALDRQNAIDGAGRQDQLIEGLDTGPSPAEHVQLALMDAPDERVGLVVDMSPDLL